LGGVGIRGPIKGGVVYKIFSWGGGWEKEDAGWQETSWKKGKPIRTPTGRGTYSKNTENRTQNFCEKKKQYRSEKKTRLVKVWRAKGKNRQRGACGLLKKIKDKNKNKRGRRKKKMKGLGEKSIARP